MTLYGRDNQIDGIVLDVLLRKHEAIRRATGVSVPVPDNTDAVVEALMEGLLLRGRDPEQLGLELDIQEKQDTLYTRWDSAADREKVALTKYAQHGIKPEEVAEELRESREALGTNAEVADFVQHALKSLRSTCTSTDAGFTATTTPLPLGLRDAIPPGRRDPLSFNTDLPVARGEAVLNRTDTTVEAIANYVWSLGSTASYRLTSDRRAAAQWSVPRRSHPYDVAAREVSLPSDVALPQRIPRARRRRSCHPGFRRSTRTSELAGSPLRPRS